MKKPPLMNQNLTVFHYYSIFFLNEIFFYNEILRKHKKKTL